MLSCFSLSFIKCTQNILKSIFTNYKTKIIDGYVFLTIDYKKFENLKKITHFT